MTTPFFPQFRPRLAACRRQAVQTVRRASLPELERYLADILPAHLLSQQDEGDHSRARVFTLALTLQCFLCQVLKPKTPCREIVRLVQALFRLLGRGPVDDSTSAYCQARRRLPRETLERCLAASAQTADRRVGKGGELQGRPVKVVDGSSTQLADTPANQKAYPQPRTQKSGCGFPVLKFLVLYSLASGAVLAVVLASLYNHDLRLLRQLYDELRAGDILLGDRAYGDYITLASLPERGVDVVARIHQGRKVDFRKARRLGKNDGLFTWRKGLQQSNILDAKQWQDLPAQITVRVIRFTATIRGRRCRRITLVTTLLDPVRYSAAALIALYARRWRLELCLRDLKTTMGMEQLRCQTPAMVEKELLAYLLAYNLVRCLMAEAVAAHQGELERVSFKGTVDALRRYGAAMAQARSQKMRAALWADLLLNLVRDQLPDRPHRQEPRAVKRRPKPYPLLTRPRHQYKEGLHRNRYWKNKPRNFKRLN
ncbi:MAG: IS4 family transposase [Verrucomicrobiota bacterium]